MVATHVVRTDRLVSKGNAMKNLNPGGNAFRLDQIGVRREEKIELSPLNLFNRKNPFLRRLERPVHRLPIIKAALLPFRPHPPGYEQLDPGVGNQPFVKGEETQKVNRGIAGKKDLLDTGVIHRHLYFPPRRDVKRDGRKSARIGHLRLPHLRKYLR